MTRSLLIDPSMLVSRRCRIWLERAAREGSAPYSIPATLLELPVRDWQFFRPPFPPAAHGGEPLLWLEAFCAKHPCALGPRLGDGGSVEQLIDEVVSHLSAGSVLVARRREFVDMMIAHGESVTQTGSTTFFDVASTITPSLGEALGGALFRRARYLLEGEGSSRATGMPLKLSDQGPGRY